ncbi:hypothetical protein [[Acholeplasma] multilocale]|uniref:hypothetical protein n=1 Tax=[Acholeplasma] multilocale TaxID=264638 RepID=UPI00047A0B27|nr:hypothetical protein [[Acholeplasma] multilocale]
MRKLTEQETKDIHGGAINITGALFDGIAKVINGFANFYSTISNSIFIHKNFNVDAVKGSIKLGDSAMTWDNSLREQPNEVQVNLRSIELNDDNFSEMTIEDEINNLEIQEFSSLDLI